MFDVLFTVSLLKNAVSMSGYTDSNDRKSEQQTGTDVE
jgi:hypothetical protein